MKEAFSGIVAVIFVMSLIFGIGLLAQGSDFLLYKFFAPRQEQVRREVFEQSKSYNDGMRQELYSLQRDYIIAKSDEQREALKSIIQHRVAGYRQDQLPIDLQIFINSL